MDLYDAQSLMAAVKAFEAYNGDRYPLEKAEAAQSLAAVVREYVETEAELGGWFSDLEQAIGEGDQEYEPEQAPTDETAYDYGFEYRLLSRLQLDCDYYLGACVKNSVDMEAAQRHLWAGGIEAQVAKMRELYSMLPEKPDWISAEDIDRYEQQMLNARDGGRKPNQGFLKEAAKAARESSHALAGDEALGSTRWMSDRC